VAREKRGGVGTDSRDAAPRVGKAMDGEERLGGSMGVQSKPKRDDFKTLKHLGEGSVGAVTKVMHKISGNVYALKSICKKKIMDHDLGAQLLSEVRTQLSMKHPNLLRCYNYFEEDGYVYLVLEYCGGGDLYRKLKSGGPLCEPEAAHVFAQVAEGLQHLHKNGIIHRDLKPENVLLTGDLCVKIADFGWCAKATDGRTTFCGTLCMLAPEMITGQPYDKAIDVWALGVLIFEMLAGVSPFDRGGGLMETCRNIVVNGLAGAPMDKVPAAVHPLVRGLLNSDPALRMALPKAVEFPWVTEQHALHLRGTVSSSGTASEEATSAPQAKGPVPEPALHSVDTCRADRAEPTPAAKQHQGKVGPAAEKEVGSSAAEVARPVGLKASSDWDLPATKDLLVDKLPLRHRPNRDDPRDSATAARQKLAPTLEAEEMRSPAGSLHSKAQPPKHESDTLVEEERSPAGSLQSKMAQPPKREPDHPANVPTIPRSRGHIMSITTAEPGVVERNLRELWGDKPQSGITRTCSAGQASGGYPKGLESRSTSASDSGGSMPSSVRPDGGSIPSSVRPDGGSMPSSVRPDGGPMPSSVRPDGVCHDAARPKRQFDPDIVAGLDFSSRGLGKPDWANPPHRRKSPQMQVPQTKERLNQLEPLETVQAKRTERPGRLLPPRDPTAFKEIDELSVTCPGRVAGPHPVPKVCREATRPQAKSIVGERLARHGRASSTGRAERGGAVREGGYRSGRPSEDDARLRDSGEDKVAEWFGGALRLIGFEAVNETGFFNKAGNVSPHGHEHQSQLTEQLISLGFNQEQAIEASKRTSSVEAAVEWIIANSG